MANAGDKKPFAIETVTVGDLRAGRYIEETSEGGDLAAMPAEFVQIASSNPLALDDHPAAFSMRKDGITVARVRLLTGKVRIDAEESTVFWDMDLISLPEERGLGAGGILVRNMIRTLSAMGACIGSYASTPAALAVYERLRMPTLGVSPRYLWPLRAGRILDAKVPPLAARVLQPVADVALRVAEPILHASQRLAARSFVFEDLEEIGLETDALFDDAPSWARGWLPGSSRVLDWRVSAIRASSAHKIVRARAIRARRGAPTLLGYTITSTRLRPRIDGHPYKNVRVTTLVDFWAREGVSGLPEAIVHDVIQQGALLGSDVVEVVTTDRDLRRALTAARFRRVGGNSVSFHGRRGGASAPTTLDDFRVTMAAGDGLFF